MLFRLRLLSILVAVSWVLSLAAGAAQAQSLGIELHNMVMPASGGMGGASIARPQDMLSAMHGNVGSLAQYEGTQFTFSGGWIESTYNLGHSGALDPLGSFYAKSEAEGSALGNIGISQDLRALGLPATVGISLMSTAGAGLNFRGVPESHGTSVTLTILQIANGISIDVTDRLSVGAAISLGTGTLDAPFVGVGAAAYDYALRGSMGATVDVGMCTDIGFYYETEQSFNFDDAVTFDQFATVQDINADLPANFGIGIANRSLLDHRLLLAADILYKQWDNAALFAPIYDDQWVLQLGAQYTVNSRLKLRAGYVYAQNPLQEVPGSSAGGVVPPGAQLAMDYLQGTLAIANKHRITGGVGIRDVLPGIDFDLFAGGMFRTETQHGPETKTAVQGYWAGAGLTWRFGRGAYCDLGVADQW